MHRFPSCSKPTVLKMAEDRRAMYDGFSDKGAHSAEWFEIAKNFLKLAFAGDRHEAKCPCNRCRKRRMFSEYEMPGHIAKHEFMPNNLVWHQHGEVQALTPAESDRSDDEDRMDDMIAYINMEYDLGSVDQLTPAESDISDDEDRISIRSLPPQMRKCMMAQVDRTAGCDASYGDEVKV
jgi:hypothetical protein